MGRTSYKFGGLHTYHVLFPEPTDKKFYLGCLESGISPNEVIRLAVLQYMQVADEMGVDFKELRNWLVDNDKI